MADMENIEGTDQGPPMESVPMAEGSNSTWTDLEKFAARMDVPVPECFDQVSGEQVALRLAKATDLIHEEKAGFPVPLWCYPLMHASARNTLFRIEDDRRRIYKKYAETRDSLAELVNHLLYYREELGIDQMEMVMGTLEESKKLLENMGVEVYAPEEI